MFFLALSNKISPRDANRISVGDPKKREIIKVLLYGYTPKKLYKIKGAIIIIGKAMKNHIVSNLDIIISTEL